MDQYHGLQHRQSCGTNYQPTQYSRPALVASHHTQGLPSTSGHKKLAGSMLQYPLRASSKRSIGRQLHYTACTPSHSMAAQAEWMTRSGILILSQQRHNLRLKGVRVLCGGVPLHNLPLLVQ
eukprot:NODE_2209_length_744_cov_70.056115_g1783_i0.p1 GENE.NODE_2209_length_744_cov_70.056115_g1783_i0~~NODE_2209_length_744_cov_70.056115_g1783_i0.p1  ORF type:complete len:138 (+),score=33.89 NODE_2209_length_744_cov_70.056115_g1783_i0:50-415(+)